MKIVDGGTGALRSPTLAEFDFDVVFTEHADLVTPSSSEQVIVDDANVLRDINAITENRFEGYAIQLAGPESVFNALVWLASNSNTSVNGSTFRWAGDGPCTLICRTPWLSRGQEVTFSRTPTTVFDTLLNYVDGSLAKNSSEDTIARATGKTAANLPVYSLQNHVTPAFTRNVNCWLYGVDLTAVSPSNSYSGGLWAGVAITPRHVLFAAHAPVPIGTVLRFVTNDNQIVTRTVTWINALAGGFDRDTAIALLDSDLPSSIAKAKFMPADWADYIPTVESFHLPTFAFDQEEKIITKELNKVYYVSPTRPNFFSMFFSDCTTSPLSELTESVISGDSGNPVFMLVNGEAVLISVWSGGGGGSGPAFHRFLDEIDAMLASLGGGYQLETVDLSGFNPY